MLHVFGKPVAFPRHVLLIVLYPVFNVVEYGHEYGSASEITRFRGSQECLNFSLDLDRGGLKISAN